MAELRVDVAAMRERFTEILREADEQDRRWEDRTAILRAAYGRIVGVVVQELTSAIIAKALEDPAFNDEFAKACGHAGGAAITGRFLE